MNLVITGSTRGIGLGLALEFLKGGHHVCINGRSGQSIRKAKEKLAEYQDQLISLAGDVARRETHEQIWEKTVKTWGSVDLWINNAGVNHPQVLPWELKVSDIDRVIDTNLKGVIHGSCVAYQGMLPQGHGKIFNMEGLGSRGPVIPTAALYATTKNSVSYFTRSFAKGVDSRIVQVGTLSPGMVVTDLLLKKEENKGLDRQLMKVINILADKVETVTPWLYRRLIRSHKNYHRIEWLTTGKIMWRFLSSPLVRRQIVSD